MGLTPTLENFSEWHAGSEVRRRAFEHGGADRSRADRIHAYVVGGVIERERAGEAVDGSFGCRIRRNPALAGMALHGCEADNGTAAAFFHLRNPEVRCEVNAADVHHQAAVPGFEISLHYRAKRMKRSRVDDNVQAAKFSYRFCHHGLYRLLLRNVALLD